MQRGAGAEIHARIADVLTAALDVDYRESTSVAAGVWFRDWLVNPYSRES